MTILLRTAAKGEPPVARSLSPAGARTLVARLDGRPVGWCTTGSPRDEDAPALLEMWSLSVDPAHQRRGVATAIGADELRMVRDTPFAGDPWCYETLLAGS
ncbi:GNAT family N-acetyltransferase [Janibacter sp. UYMM211]|uniref:GNAT family N-acetyltransferase n=1 Tax=Janibacter sp. UYMM211 TaxID=3156342 RepID=UPI0033962F65